VVGVAPGTKRYAVKVVNAQGSGTDAQVICGIDWVTANAASLGIKVANMSLGGPGADDGNCGNTNGDALHRAICNSVAAGVTYVVAAGNSSEDFSADVPANYNEVLTVTAMADFDGLSGGLGTPSCGDGYFENDDAAAGFSNFTTEASAVDTVAPVITSVSSSAVTHEAARITWTTDENADSQVEYGTTVAYGSATQVASAFVTSHTVDLSGLSPTTLYHYRVKSRDGW